MSEKKLTLDEILNVDLKLSIDENAKNILASLKKYEISFTEFSNELTTNRSVTGTSEDVNDTYAIYNKVHELYLKEHLTEKFTKENKNLEHPKTQEEIAKLADKGVDKVKKFVHNLEHDLTDKKAAQELKELLNTIVESIKNQKMENQVNKEEKKEPKLMFKKDDVLFYQLNNNIRVGKVVNDSFNDKETILKPIIYDKESKSFKEIDKLVSINNEKLSKPFKYKNIKFDDLSNKDKLNLVLGKQTDVYKSENTYKANVDGKDVEKIYEQDVKFQLKKNQKGVIVPKVIKPFFKQAYGKSITENDLEILKKGGILISDARTRQGKDFEFLMKFDYKLKGIIVEPFNVKYLKNNKGISEKAYVGGKVLNKKNIQDLISGKSVKIAIKKNSNEPEKNISIGFAELSTIQKRFGFDQNAKENAKENVKEKAKESVKENKPKRRKRKIS